MDAGRFEEAQALLMRQLRGKPHPHTYHLLAIAFETLGQLEQAIYYAQKGAGADPNDAILAAGLAQRLFVAGRSKESLAQLEAFAATRPADAAIMSARVAMLTKLDREQEALALAEGSPPSVRDGALMIDARAGALTKLGRLDDAEQLYTAGGRPFGRVHVLMARGRTEEAAAELKSLCEKFPNDEGAWTFYASTLNYIENVSLEEVLRAHRQYGAATRQRIGSANTSWNVTPDPDRKLRIGIVSPDLRLHAIVSFLAPLLENYDRSQWHVTAYSTHFKQDGVSARLKGLVDQWRWLPTSHTQLLVRRMREDNIDVAIELSGHTEGHKLDAMHARPAPVQVTYLGYPNTTGLETIDLRIVDSITDPPGSEKLASERLARIDPCFLCFKPIDGAPELAPPPMIQAGRVMFGSFNLPKKISPGTLAMWGRLLAETPGSGLVLKHAVLEKEWTRELLRARLVDAGIDTRRVTILPPAPSYADHLGSYAKVDVALDTYPYHGTTTTCEAMWMGVPVITLRGDRHPARVGASLLSVVGLGDLVAEDASDFVRIAAGLGADPTRLAAWRTPGPGSLREIMARSPLCDAPAFARRFEGVIRDAWRAWCAGRAADAGTNVPR